MFCLECGREDEETFNGLCRACFTAQNPLVTIPTELEVEICAHCNSIHTGDKWKESNQSEEDIIAKTVAEHSIPDKNAKDVELALEITSKKGSVLEILVTATGYVLGEIVEKEFNIKVKINRTVCPECSKYASGYYEAVLQLRADGRPLEVAEIEKADEIIRNQLEKLSGKNRMAYLSERTVLKEGIDYYIGSYKAAKKLSTALKEEMGGLIGESPRLMGRDKSTGKDLYRIWISLRLPSFCKRDFVEYNNQILQILSFNGQKIVLMDLDILKIVSISWREYGQLQKLLGNEEIKSTTVTSKSPDTIQILHPESYQPLDLEMRPDLSKINIGEEVEVVEIRGRVYILKPQDKNEIN